MALSPFDETLRDALIEAFGDTKFGMLGIVGAHDHMQPMTHYFDAETMTLRFITASDTELVGEIGQGATARFTLTTRDGTFYACIHGPIRQSEDREALDAIWSPAAAAWFEGGRDDPKITLLEMPIREAAIWTVTDSSLKFGVEMLRANVAHDTPDVGRHGILRLAEAA